MPREDRREDRAEAFKSRRRRAEEGWRPPPPPTLAAYVYSCNINIWLGV